MSGKADSEVGCTTHLTIHFSRSVKINEVNDYGDKKGYARKRVRLANEQVSPNLKAEITTREKAPVGTDPYRPPVGTTPSDDVQLKIKSCNILPTGSAD
jgi:hypothetical protein